MSLFVTPIIKSGSEILAFALEAVNFASPIINSVLEIIISAPDTTNFGFQKSNCELETIISGLDMVIVKPSITNCVPVAVKSETEAVLVVVEIIISSFEAVISSLNVIISGRKKIISRPTTIKLLMEGRHGLTASIYFDQVTFRRRLIGTLRELQPCPVEEPDVLVAGFPVRLGPDFLLAASVALIPFDSRRPSRLP